MITVKKYLATNETKEYIENNRNDIIYLKSRELNDFRKYLIKIVEEIKERYENKEEYKKYFVDDHFFKSASFFYEINEAFFDINRSAKNFIENNKINKKVAREMLSTLNIRKFFVGVIKNIDIEITMSEEEIKQILIDRITKIKLLEYLMASN